MNTYRAEATKERLNQMGISSAWQQGQERLNRELKAYRQNTGLRSVTNIIDEVRTLTSKQGELEEMALYGRGDMRVAQHLQHLIFDESQWANMTNEEKSLAYATFRSSTLGTSMHDNFFQTYIWTKLGLL